MRADLLDQLMAVAWPPEVLIEDCGWRLRWTRGLTRRANSVLAAGGAEAPERIDRAEEFYAERSATPLFQVSTSSTPAWVRRLLEERQYQAEAATMVMTAAASDVMAHTDPGDWWVEVADAPTDDWLDSYWQVESVRGRCPEDRSVFRDVLLKPPKASFATVADGEDIAAAGQLVHQGRWGGIQCMATLPTHRRRGAATSVLHALAGAAVAARIDRLYLGVMASNTGAVALYRSCGFRRSHSYSYFRAPA